MRWEKVRCFEKGRRKKAYIVRGLAREKIGKVDRTH